jgi:hypothetical protein
MSDNQDPAPQISGSSASTGGARQNVEADRAAESVTAGPLSATNDQQAVPESAVAGPPCRHAADVESLRLQLQECRESFRVFLSLHRPDLLDKPFYEQREQAVSVQHEDGSMTIGAQAAIDLVVYLGFHEGGIAHGINDFGTLAYLFRVVMERHPSLSSSEPCPYQNDDGHVAHRCPHCSVREPQHDSLSTKEK